MIKKIFINDIETNYLVNNQGEVFNATTKIKLNGWIDIHGYRVVSINISPKGEIYKFVKKTIHRLVANAFIPNPENKPQVNHIDGNKLNNNVSNLEWVTNKENYIHARTYGLIKTGDSLKYASVDNETVHKICELITKGYSNINILLELGLPTDVHGQGLITRIRTGRSWKDISSQYEFIKKGSLKKVSDELLHEICKKLEQKFPLKEIFKSLGLVYGIEYQRLKSLVYDIRTKKSHKSISDQYNIPQY